MSSVERDDAPITLAKLTRAELAIDATGCPRCGQVRRKPCVGSRVPDDVRHRPSLAPMVAREGKPISRPHDERFRELWLIEQRRKKPFVPLPPPTTRARIALALTEHDRREGARLVEWLAAGGAALLVSAEQLPVVEFWQRECPKCDHPTRTRPGVNMVECTDCAWWGAW